MLSHPRLMASSSLAYPLHTTMLSHHPPFHCWLIVPNAFAYQWLWLLNRWGSSVIHATMLSSQWSADTPYIRFRLGLSPANAFAYQMLELPNGYGSRLVPASVPRRKSFVWITYFLLDYLLTRASFGRWRVHWSRSKDTLSSTMFTSPLFRCQHVESTFLQNFRRVRQGSQWIKLSLLLMSSRCFWSLWRTVFTDENRFVGHDTPTFMSQLWLSHKAFKEFLRPDSL